MIFVVLPQVEILDLAGPLQAFSEVPSKYRVRVCSYRDRIEAHQGIVLADLDRLPDVDASAIVVVPGMPYAATQRVDRTVTRWLANAARAGAHLASVCTGAFILGDSGLLDGRRCTTHWSRISELARRFPKARVLEDRLYVTDGDVTTSAGIASGIDMALAFIEQAEGPLVAAEVAREMVVYLRRDGAQEQSSVYLDYRTHIHPGVHRAQDFIVQNPRSRVTLSELANLAGMSPRSLTRTFRAATGISVHQFTTRVRAEFARTLMHDPGLTMDAIAQRCGLSARQLRRLRAT
ncbi:MAG TPA: DJ-1/PfpI family protein [Thermoanaerobaculia bacterium]|nr:DJ-1/PfpI family protein [Thermoanaerobaculia bacterium]